MIFIACVRALQTVRFSTRYFIKHNRNTSFLILLPAHGGGGFCQKIRAGISGDPSHTWEKYCTRDSKQAGPGCHPSLTIAGNGLRSLFLRARVPVPWWGSPCILPVQYLMPDDNRPALSKSWELLGTEVFMDPLEMPAESTLEPGWRAVPTPARLARSALGLLSMPAESGAEGGGAVRVFYSPARFPCSRSMAFCERPPPSTDPALQFPGFMEKELLLQ